jgi:hypothetical protein
MPLSGGDSVSGLRGWFSRLAPERRADSVRPAVVPEPAPSEDPVVASKVLPKFLSYLATRPAPVILDLGPFSGSNVTFFGQLLSCKVLIEDLFEDFDRHAREGRLDALPPFLSKRFTVADASVDGVLLWDLCDYLDRPAAQALGTALTRLLRPDGALLAFFGNASHIGSPCTKFIVADESHLRVRPHTSTVARQGWLQNRDIIKMFEGMRVADSFLLKNGRREMLFRKGGVGRPII